jgi:hypothetical protein
VNKEFVNENYERMKEEEERKGFRIHRTVYLCVISMLTLINLIVTPEFLWCIFPLAGMSIGLAFHYFIKGGI